MRKLYKYLLFPLFFGNIGLISSQGLNTANRFEYSGEEISKDDDSNILKIRILKDFTLFIEDVYEFHVEKSDSFYYDFNLKANSIGFIEFQGVPFRIFIPKNSSLGFSFDKDNFYESLHFTGKNSSQNNYLVAAQREFSMYDEKFFQYEISRSSPFAFQKLINRIYSQKQLFFQDYKNKSKTNFSSEFEKFAKADIDYWRAYLLLKFRIENPFVAGTDNSFELPDDYYSFFNVINISNDDALLSIYYHFFLDQFITLLVENTGEFSFLKEEKPNLEINKNTLLIQNGFKGISDVEQLKKGTKLILADKRIFQNKKNLSEESLIKVKTTKGKSGWVKFGDIKMNDIKSNDITYNPNEKVVKVRKINRYVQARLNRIEIRKDPFEKEVIGYLERDERALFLNNRTVDLAPYNFNGKTYYDYYNKIRTNAGLEGWVFRGGVSMIEVIEEVEEHKIVGNYSVVSSSQIMNDFFTGRTLSHVLAKNIYFRSLSLKPEEIKEDVFNFIKHNPYEEYDQLVQRLYSYLVHVHASGGVTWSDFFSNKVIEVKNNYKQGLQNDQKEKEKTVVTNLKMKEEEVFEVKKDETAVEVEKNEPMIKDEIPAKKPINTIPEVIEATEYVSISNFPCQRKRTATTITGAVDRYVASFVKLIMYIDPILFREDVRYLTIKNGTFSEKIDLAEPVYGELVYNNQKIDVYLEPGDNLSIKFRGDDFFNSVSFLGKGSKHNNFLIEKKRKFIDLFDNLETKKRYAEHSEFVSFMDSSLEEMKKWYKNYDVSGFSKSFTLFADIDARFWYYFNLLRYPWEHPVYRNEPAPMQLPDSYYSFLNDISISVDGAIVNHNYNYFLDMYIDYLMSKNKGESKWEIAGNYLKGEAMYFYKAKLLVSYCHIGKAKEYGNIIKDFIAECPYDTYNDVLRVVYNEEKGIVEGTKAPEFILKDNWGRDVTLDDFLGKVVYVDFWATWCSPCIRNMAYSKKLQEKYRGKDVVFLYISLDKSEETWKNFVRGHGYSGVHVLAATGKPHQSDVAKLFNVKGVPAYFLIDKDGNIAFSPAYNPVTSGVMDQIDSLLK